MKRQLDEAEADLVLVNKRLDDAQGIEFIWRLLVRVALCQYLTLCMLDADGTAALEGLRAELAKAKEQARKSDAAAGRAREELKAEQASHCRSKDEMADLAVKLKSATDRCKLLEEEGRARQTDLEKAVSDAKDARSGMRGAKEELRQAGLIADGKPFPLRRKFCDPKFAPLDRAWSMEDTYLDLAASAAGATRYFQERKDHEVKKLFWSQFANPERPLGVDDRLAQWAELNRLSGLAMSYAMDRLCPGGSKPKSYFSLVQQFLDVMPQVEALKRSACMEGARLALARVKTYWADMEPTIVASHDSDRNPMPVEHYFEELLVGARIIETQCLKDVVL